MNKIDNQNLNVNNLFKNFYLVPDYQREYVWEEKHVNQLMEDIYEEFDNNKQSEYFIGSMVVCASDDNFFEVIDGQQRLTTLFLCLCALKKYLKYYDADFSDIEGMLFSKRRDAKGKLIATYRLVLQYEHSLEILEQVANDVVPNSDLIGSALRIAEAYNYILRFIETNLKNKEDLELFLGYFLNNVKLIQIETPHISDALKIFETINERGVGLNPMDLLKNLIFRQIKKKEFDRLKIEWKKITSLLENNDEKPLRFLRYFIMANYSVKNSKGEEIIREDEIYNWITKDENIAQCNYEEKPFEFVKFMLSNADAYIKFINGRDSNGNNNAYLDNIKRLSGSFRQHLMLLLAAKDLEKSLFDYLAKQIEVLIFFYIITKEQTKEFERKFSRWAKEIKKIRNKEDLNKFLENYLMSEIDSKKSDFENAFLRYTAKTLQQYRLRYILAKLTQYIDQQYLGYYDDRDLSSYIMKGIEIEHILPNTPTPELRSSFGEGYDDYKIKLGNLTLLEKPINIVAGRNYFQLKLPEYKKSKFYLTKSINMLDVVGKNSSINRINQFLKSFTTWDKITIDERQSIMKGLANQIWKIDLLN